MSHSLGTSSGGCTSARLKGLLLQSLVGSSILPCLSSQGLASICKDCFAFGQQNELKYEHLMQAKESHKFSALVEDLSGGFHWL